MILVISRSKKDAVAISEMFHFMGILSTAVTHRDAASEISCMYRSVLVSNPEELYDELEFTKKLRSYALIPIFAFGEPRHPEAFDGVFSQKVPISKVFIAMRDHCREKGLMLPGTYQIAGIDVSATTRIPIFFFHALPFTKTEIMIMRALVRLYPIPAKNTEILKYAFRASRLPEPSSVRTHISVINKKFRKIAGRNIISQLDGKGYVILTPEMLDKKRELLAR